MIEYINEKKTAPSFLDSILRSLAPNLNLSKKKETYLLGLEYVWQLPYYTALSKNLTHS
jgi:hypothetical protein